MTITPTGTPGAGGLLGALVYGIADGYRKASAEKEARGLVEALQGFDFKDAFRAAAADRLGALPNVKIVVRPIVNTTSGTPAAQALYDQSQDTSVMFVSARMAFNSGDLVLTAAASIFPKSPQLMPFRPKPNDAQPLAIGNAIFTNMVHAPRKSVTPANIRANLVDAINEVTSSLASGLQGTQ